MSDFDPEIELLRARAEVILDTLLKTSSEENNLDKEFGYLQEYKDFLVSTRNKLKTLDGTIVSLKEYKEISEKLFETNSHIVSINETKINISKQKLLVKNELKDINSVISQSELSSTGKLINYERRRDKK